MLNSLSECFIFEELEIRLVEVSPVAGYNMVILVTLFRLDSEVDGRNKGVRVNKLLP